MGLHAKLSNLFNKMGRHDQMTILTEFGNLHISLKRKDILQKNYPVVFVMPCSIYHKNISEIEFLTLAAKLRMCLIFTGRHF